MYQGCGKPRIRPTTCGTGPNAGMVPAIPSSSVASSADTRAGRRGFDEVRQPRGLRLRGGARRGTGLHEVGVEDLRPDRRERLDEPDELREVGLVEMGRREVGRLQGDLLREVFRLVLQRGGLERHPRQIELRVVESGFPQLRDLLRERLPAVRRAPDAHGRAKETVPIMLPRGFKRDSSVWRPVVLELLFVAAVGIAIGLSLAAPPGPVNAIIASRTVTRSWRAGFLVGAGATIADTVFLTLSVMAHSLLGSIATWLPYISLVGAAVMAYFAWTGVRALRSPEEILAPRAEAEAKPDAIGLSLNITNPQPILWWPTAGPGL